MSFTKTRYICCPFDFSKILILFFLTPFYSIRSAENFPLSVSTLTSERMEAACPEPEWQPYPSVYQTGDRVVYNGTIYEAQTGPIWVQPGLGEHWWKTIGPCEGETEKTAQTITFPAISNKLTTDTDFSLNATASSGLPVTYSISGPASLNGNVVQLNGTEGLVVVTASQAGTATFEAAPEVVRSFTVTAPELGGAELNLVATKPSCSEGADGSIQANVSGGLEPYAFLWNNGATTAQLINLTAGVYSLTVTDANDQTATAELTLEEPAPVTITAQVQNANSGNSDGAIISTVTGGEQPYSYNWSTGASSANLTNILAGNYTLTVTDGNACLTTASYQVEEQTPAQCDEPTWDPDVVYLGGALVSYNNNVYEAAYWTQGNNPEEFSSSYQHWKLKGPCSTGGNRVPEIQLLAPVGPLSQESPAVIEVKVVATDQDGAVEQVEIVIEGQSFNATQNGDTWLVNWTPPAFGDFPWTATATDNEGATASISFTLEIDPFNPDSDFIITEAEFDAIFPYRFGVDIATGVIAPANDFFSFAALVEAVERMKDIRAIFERRRGTNLYRVTRVDLLTGAQEVIREDEEFNYSHNLSKEILTQVVDYGDFSNEGDFATRRREMAAFLANISQETTGGWPTAPGGQYAWGLHFRQEVGYEGCATCLGYRDENNSNYPPAPGKSYHGRGPIQLSWNYNYGQVSEFLYGDKFVLLNDPDLVVSDGALAFQTAIWFWMTPQNPKPSAHDVMVGNWTPSCFDIPKGRSPGLGMTINIINGGLECGSGTENTKVVNRIGHYQRHSGILGSSLDVDGGNTCDACGCANQQSYGGFEGEPDECPGGSAIQGTVVSQNNLNRLGLAAFPNPTNGELELSFELSDSRNVRMELLDLRGNVLQTIIQEQMGPGVYRIPAQINMQAAGLYFIRLQKGDQLELIKISTF